MTVASGIASKRVDASDVLRFVEPGADVIVGIANAEPTTVLDAMERGADRLHDVRLHQMDPFHERRYMYGEIPNLRHVSWFLSAVNRDAFAKGLCDLVPNNFHDVPNLLRRSTKCSLAVVAVAPPDRHGFFSLGCHADYLAALTGDVPFFVEVNHQMPRTFGENQVHVSQVVGWSEADYPLVEVTPREPGEADRAIAALVAERIPDGATLQVGIGSIPNVVLGMLAERRDLGIHTEVLTDGVVDLIEAGVITGTRKRTHRNKTVATLAIGSRRLYDFCADNPGIEFWPVDHTNAPATIATEDRIVSVNATLEVDFLGQCASESLGAHYRSSSGGQPDFAQGALAAEHGQSFVVLHSTTRDLSVSRIVPTLQAGAAVTTFKNVVDKVVTEYGVAELRGSSIRERARRLIGIAHPQFRQELEQRARTMGYL